MITNYKQLCSYIYIYIYIPTITNKTHQKNSVPRMVETTIELSPTIPNETKKDNTKQVEEKGGKDFATFQECIMLADRNDLMWLALGLFGAAVNGIGDPAMMIFFGEGMSDLAGANDMLKAMSNVAIWMTVLGCVLHVAGSLQYLGMSVFAKRQGDRFKRKWFEAVMRQDMAWYDINDPTEIPGRIASSIPIYEKGFGLKLAEAVQFTVTFLTALIAGFYYNPYISLFTMGLSPLVVYTGIQIIEVNSKASEARTNSYAKANAIAYEVFSSFKTILSFNSGNVFKAKFTQAVATAEESGKERSFSVGWATGALMSSFIAMYAGITLFGGWMLWMQVEENGCDPSGAASPRNECNHFKLSQEQHGAGIIIALLCIAFGGQAFGQISTALEAVTSARKAIKSAVDVIKRVPVIDICSEEGVKPSSISGSIDFRNVDFTYPARPDTQVLNHLNLNIQAGKTYAFVGGSGCGKSTIMQLVQRFYDADEGQIFFDKYNIKDLNLKWLRKQMAIVSQEPKLFSGTIRENILNGVSAFGIEATEEEVINAAKMANAHDFIMQFPEGYDTDVGHGGSQLSGGQKQRVAIARALISNPKLLLLDEATSALDNTSEKVVQKALDRLIAEGNGRTTLVIAHRLTTIRNADQICFVKEGKIVEQGTHDELMATRGHYYGLVTSQDGVDEEAPVSSSDNTTKNSTVLTSKEEITNSIEIKNPVMEVASISPNTTENVVKKDESETDDKSVSSEIKEKEEGEYKVDFSRIWELNKPDLNYLLLGSLGALVLGPTYPAWGWIFGIMMDVFYMPIFACSEDAGSQFTPAVLTLIDDNGVTYTTCDEYFTYKSNQIRTRSFNVFWAWLVLIFLIQLSNVATFYGFGAASERLAKRIRVMMFDHYLKQEPGYFDLPENAVGEICTRLEKDATCIKSKTGEPIQAFIVFLFGVFGGVALSIYFCWPIGLMSLATMPIVAVGFVIQMSIIMGTDEVKQDDTSGSGAILGECIGGMKTVTSLSLQSVMSEKFGTFVNENEMKGHSIGENF